MDDNKVYVVDRIVTRPGCAQRFLKTYMTEYAPGARGRDMVLKSVLVSPPLWLDDGSNEVTITWTVIGTSGWWDMTRAGRGDNAVRQWWAEAESMIVERHRSMAVEASSIDGFADV